MQKEISAVSKKNSVLSAERNESHMQEELSAKCRKKSVLYASGNQCCMQKENSAKYRRKSVLYPERKQEENRVACTIFTVIANSICNECSNFNLLVIVSIIIIIISIYIAPFSTRSSKALRSIHKNPGRKGIKVIHKITSNKFQKLMYIKRVVMQQK